MIGEVVESQILKGWSAKIPLRGDIWYKAKRKKGGSHMNITGRRTFQAEAIQRESTKS